MKCVAALFFFFFGAHCPDLEDLWRLQVSVLAAWHAEPKCHARLHRNAALMGLCCNAKWTRAAKRLPANLYDPLTTRHGFARVPVPAGRERRQACIISSPLPAIALLRSAEFPQSSRADYIHVVFSLAAAPRGPVLWKRFDWMKVNAE